MTKPANLLVPPHGDAFFGHHATDDSRRFDGRLDNVHLYNFAPGHQEVPPAAECEVVP